MNDCSADPLGGMRGRRPTQTSDGVRIWYVQKPLGPKVSYSLKPTNTAASSTLFRSETTTFAGKLSSGQPNAMLFMIT